MPKITLSSNFEDLVKLMRDEIPREARGIIVASANRGLTVGRDKSVDIARSLLPGFTKKRIGDFITIVRANKAKRTKGVFSSGSLLVSKVDLGYLLYRVSRIGVSPTGGKSSMKGKINKQNQGLVIGSGKYKRVIGKTSKISTPFSHQRFAKGRYFVAPRGPNAKKYKIRHITFLGPALIFHKKSIKIRMEVIKAMQIEYTKTFDIRKAKAKQRLESKARGLPRR